MVASFGQTVWAFVAGGTSVLNQWSINSNSNDSSAASGSNTAITGGAAANTNNTTNNTNPSTTTPTISRWYMMERGLTLQLQSITFEQSYNSKYWFELRDTEKSRIYSKLLSNTVDRLNAEPH